MHYLSLKEFVSKKMLIMEYKMDEQSILRNLQSIFIPHWPTIKNKRMKKKIPVLSKLMEWVLLLGAMCWRDKINLCEEQYAFACKQKSISPTARCPNINKKKGGLDQYMGRGDHDWQQPSLIKQFKNFKSVADKIILMSVNPPQLWNVSVRIEI